MNMFCGTGISVLASEEFLDAPREGKNLEDFLTEMIVGSPKMLNCKTCGRIVVLRYKNGEAQIRSYIPESEEPIQTTQTTPGLRPSVSDL